MSLLVSFLSQRTRGLTYEGADSISYLNVERVMLGVGRGVASPECEICDLQKPLGMAKMVATFYSPRHNSRFEPEWRRGE